jgi:peptidoglycan/LPS O-acetylase OafA/YrhL
MDAIAVIIDHNQVAPPLILSKDKKTSRNVTLDVIRGIAILMVILSHLALVDKQVVITSLSKYIQLCFSVIKVGGWSGVDLFFVLSGFLISGLLFKEYRQTGTIKVKTFLIRRGFKIYPGFVLFIVFTFVFETLLSLHYHKSSFLTTDYVKDLFFLHNYLGGRWDTTWSLDVEEAFYFLLPVFLLIYIHFNKISLKGLINSYLVLLILGIIGRYIMNMRYPAYNFQLQYTYSHLRLDALFFGVLLSFLYHYHKEQLFAFFSRFKYVIMIGSILMILPDFIFRRDQNNWISIYLLSTNPIAYGSLLILALKSKSKVFGNGVLAFIGRNSYAMYLWFPFLNVYLQKYFQPHASERSFTLYFILYITGTILVGMLITKAIEQPLLKLRDRLYGKQSLGHI